jgi:hemerythrin
MALGKKYSTGVVWQDFQHRQLMDLFFKVKEAKAKKTGDDVFKYSLSFLAMYVNHHFKLEEEYMDIYYYPDTDLHKKEHKDLIKKIKSFRKNYTEHDEQSINKLLITLNDWILNHILENDKKLGEYIISCEQKAKQ